MAINTDSVSDTLTPSTGTVNISGYTNTLNTFGFKNRIINGAMVIAQYGTSAVSATTTNARTYVACDRWAYQTTVASKFTVASSTTAPAGFINSLLVTSSTAYTPATGDAIHITQPIEGLNITDLGWGAVGASSITISFWVRSSLTGTFGGALQNSASSYSYPFTYTINSANTFEQKTITITGPTSGTWLTTNGVGIFVIFSLGVGTTYAGTAGSWSANNYQAATGQTNLVATNGATLYITGVQLEKGSTATSFDYRPYGTELALCQRYYEQSVQAQSMYQPNLGATNRYFTINFMVIKRANPTMTATFDQGGSGTSSVTMYTGASNAGLGNSVAAQVLTWTSSAEL